MSNQTTRVGKQHLIEVAESLFIEYGYQAVSIRDIAQAGGVTNAALYYYFPNKEALFSEVLTYHVGCLQNRLNNAAAMKSDHRDRIVAMLLAYSEHVAESRSPLFLLRFKADKVAKEEIYEQHSQHAQHIKDMIQPFEDELRMAIKAGVLKPLPEGYSPASFLLGLFHGMVQHRRASKDWEISPEDVTLVVDIFWKGMSSKSETKNK
jgi:AcrR family transcriptional regulator